MEKEKLGLGVWCSSLSPSSQEEYGVYGDLRMILGDSMSYLAEAHYSFSCKILENLLKS